MARRVRLDGRVGVGTVIRGGYGISYVPLKYTSNVTQKDPPFISVYVYQGTRSLSQGLQPPAPASGTAPASIPDAVALNFKNTEIQQFNLNVQKDFKGNVLTVGYVGALGRHVATTIGDLNGVIPSPGVSACLALSGTPAQTTCLDPLRPFFSSVPSLTTATIGEYFTNGTSSYHALQASFDRRLQNGLTFNVNYTYAHPIDDVKGLNNQKRDR